MAAHTEKSAEELSILSRIATTRVVLGSEVELARQRLDVRTRIKKSIFAKPLAWLGGSAGAGLLASFVLRGRRSRRVPAPKGRGIFGFLFGSIFSLARPALEAWAMKALRDRFPEPGQV